MSDNQPVNDSHGTSGPESDPLLDWQPTFRAKSKPIPSSISNSGLVGD